MPAPRWLARANKVGLNRLAAFIAPWAPGWAVVIHRGRRSGVGRPLVNYLRAAGADVRAVTRTPDTAGFPADVEVLTSPTSAFCLTPSTSRRW
jgi:hypothetical protein